MADKVQSIMALVDRYWSLAYDEGKEGRNHDTPDGAAQATLLALKSAIREAIAAPGVADEWKPIESAPRSGVILLAVKSGNDSRVFAAEMSNDHDIGGDVWNITTGWGGWTRLHKGWTPVAWQPRPAAPSPTAEQPERPPYCGSGHCSCIECPYAPPTEHEVKPTSAPAR